MLGEFLFVNGGCFKQMGQVTPIFIDINRNCTKCFVLLFYSRRKLEFLMMRMMEQFLNLEVLVVEVKRENMLSINIVKRAVLCC